MSHDATPSRRLPGTPFALPEDMDEHNNLTARLKALEARFTDMDRRMYESHESWTHGVNKIAEGIKETHQNLYHPQSGLFVRMDRIEHGMQAQNKFKAWLVGFATSGMLLVAGAVLGKLLGK